MAERYRLTPTRARLLPAGAALMLAFMERYELETVEVSEASMREGAVLAIRHAGPAWRSQSDGADRRLAGCRLPSPRRPELLAGQTAPDGASLRAR